MRARLRWGILGLLAVGALAGPATAWRLEAVSSDPAPADGPASRLRTPVLSVRRVPTVVAGPIADRRLVAELDALMAFLPPDACLVVEGPDLRFDHRGGAPMVPASTAKLLTATAALRSLPSETRFRTSAVAAAKPADGVVAGDLHLLGGGDALLATPEYAARFRRQPQTFTDITNLVDAVVAAGIRRVDGAVVGDDGRYDAQREVAGWPDRYANQNVVGPLSALVVNDGFARFPGPGGVGDPLEAASDPPAHAAAVVTELLRSRGVVVVGEPRAGVSPPTGVEVAAVESPPLGDVVREMLQESDNGTAELLLKELGWRAGSGTTAAGADAVEDQLALVDVDLGGTVVADGSGLSLDGRVTCTLLVDLLTRPGTGAELGARLPVAGESGTLADRFVGTPLQGRLRAKTGSLNTVASLAGLVEDDDAALAFALIVNVPSSERLPPGVAALQERVGEVLLGWPRVPDIDRLGPMTEDG